MPETTDCVHCGLCLESCPTYLELATEADSPRGRIVIMRAIGDGRLSADGAALRHLDLCLDCRACESACPSGVRYGQLIESTREAAAHLPREARGIRRVVAMLSRWVSLHVLPYPRRLRRAAWLLQLANAIGLPEWLRHTGLDDRFALPPLLNTNATSSASRRAANSLADRGGAPSPGACQAPMALFLGCASDVLAPQINIAARAALQSVGYCDNSPPPDYQPRRRQPIAAAQTCCGAIHHHAGESAQALAFARRNIAAFESARGPIVVTAAGCGAMLKEYGRLLARDPAFADRAHAFSARIKDVTELLSEASADHHAPPRPDRDSAMPLPTVCYHDPCHLCHAQGIRAAPRKALQSLAGITPVPLAESEVCCGAAGTYMLSQPQMSRRLAIRKWDNIRRAGAQVVATANIGCILQLQQHQPLDLAHVRVCHVVELL